MKIKLFQNISKHKNPRNANSVHYMIDERCKECGAALTVGGLTAVGEAWCPLCRERRYIK